MGANPMYLQINLEQMAAQANLSTLSKYGPSLPPGWVNVSLIASSNSMPPPVPPSQGFLAYGPVDESGNLGYVLALGMTWNAFLLNQFSGSLLQTLLPATIAGTNQPLTAFVSQPHASAYQQMRNSIWSALGQMNAGMPLYICGMGIAAPLAQIAGIDLRPGNKGPSSQDAPSIQPPSYVFSAVNFASQDFATYYNGMVTGATVIWAGTSTLPVDLFPTQPNNNDFVQLGKSSHINTSNPSRSNSSWLQLPSSSQPFDVPWLERSDIFYLNALGGTPAIAPVIPASISNAPAGFSQVTAATMTLLTQASYQLSRDITGTTGNISPYQFVQYINYQGTPFAFVFQSAAAVTVVFRGTVTWQEFITLEANSNFSTPSFINDGQSNVHSGAYMVYSGPVSTSTSAQTFAQSLLSALQPLVSNKTLYFTGHGLGGAIATIAAADYAFSNYGFKPAALYTFGATLPGDYNFAGNFNQAFTNSYQVLRPKDKIPGAILTLGFSPVNNAVTLNGQLAVDESTFHSLFGYLVLLNPSSNSIPAAAKKQLQKEVQ